MIAVVDYRAGNLASVRLALEYLQAPAHVTQDPAEVLRAERVIFPGVGAAKTAMTNLEGLGLVETLKTAVARGTPFLGICLGMQVIFEHSEEDGGTGCIGIVPGTVERFRPKDRMCKIPQIGWNRVHIVRNHPLLDGIEEDSEFYFVHSFYPSPSDKTYTIGETEYADTVFCSIAGKGNVFATQFHPERSGRIGLQILKNFSQWDGTC